MFLYYMFNKPATCITARRDPRHKTVMDYFPEELRDVVFPVGRLDKDTEGLLLLTNDGALAEHLTHPKHEIPKIYRVTVRGKVDEPTLRALCTPMRIDGYRIRPVKTRLCTYHTAKDRTVLEMALFEGRNRQIRKMCATVGLEITRLCRIAIGDLRLGTLPPGKWRLLSDEEIQYLFGKPSTTASHVKKGTPHA